MGASPYHAPQNTHVQTHMPMPMHMHAVQATEAAEAPKEEGTVEVARLTLTP